MMNYLKQFLVILFILNFNSYLLISQNDTVTNKDSRIVVLNNYLQWTTNYASQKKFDSSNKYAKRALNLSKEINIEELSAAVYYSNAKAMYWQDSTYEAIEYLAKNIQNIQLKDSIKIKSLKLLGNIYNYKQEYALSLQQYITAEKVVRKNKKLTKNDSLYLSEIYLSTAFLHENQKNQAKAVSYYYKALDFNKKPKFETFIIYQLSTNFESENRLRKAINVSLRGIEISEKNHLKVYIPSYYYSISSCYLKLGIGDSAIFYGKKGLIDNKDCQLDYLFNSVGKGYSLNKDYKSAVSNYENALAHSSEKFELEIHENLRDAFTSLGNYKKAIVHNNQYLKLKNIEDSLKVRQEMLEITERYESEKKQLEISLLKSDNEHISFVVKKQKSQLALISISLLLSILLILALVYYYLKQKKHRQLLFDKNRQLAKKIKNKEIHFNSIEVSEIEKKIEINNIDDSQKERIHNFIKESITNEFYLDKNISLSLLAKQANTNTAYLSKVINEDYEKSFVNFVNELRISHTLKNLEINSTFRNLTIEHIAEKAGFSSSSAFYNAFKKFTGLTPSYYIKKRIKQEVRV